MRPQEFLNEAISLSARLIAHYRYLHEHAELGFSLPKTTEYVRTELEKLGLSPKSCGKSGIVATIGKGGGSCFLLRADMDALPIKEESSVPFAHTGDNMHACGHDMHTAMLLGAAELLKHHEDELCGTVKLMFQPAEETLEGAADMIKNGVLEDPSVDAAMMIHVLSAMPFRAGTTLISAPGVSAPAADYFSIHVHGKGSHGATPHLGIDPISVAAHLLLALQNIHARELASSDEAVLTIGKLESSSKAANVIPDRVTMEGTLRASKDDIRDFLKKRLREITASIAEAFGARAEVIFEKGCPTLMNDEALSKKVKDFTVELLGEDHAFSTEEMPNAGKSGEKSVKGSGSEDFAYISHAVPSVMVAMAAGEIAKGFAFPQHHPKVRFDEHALPIGAAVYAWNAIRFLESR